MATVINEKNLIPVSPTIRLDLTGATVYTLSPPNNGAILLIQGEIQGTRLILESISDPLGLNGYEVLPGMFLTVALNKDAEVKVSAQNATNSTIQYQWFRGLVR